eukprot:3428269-Rhodomonas_salina.1
MAAEFLLEPGFNLQLLNTSKRLRKWTTSEHQCWMQMVVLIFPVNSYLHQIGKHPTGECPWCPGTSETLTHFQCKCQTSANNSITAHNAIARAVMAALKDQSLPHGWQLFYETPFNSLPVHFEWASVTEASRERQWRPDGVAYNVSQQKLFFLEFTRAMDHPSTMQDALRRKQRQYAAEEQAMSRAQAKLPLGL